MTRLFSVTSLTLLCGLLVSGCGKDAKATSAEGAGKKPFHHSMNLPSSKRVLGSWEMDLDNVPQAAMTPDLQQYVDQGLSDKVRIVYTFTDTEFILEKMGAGGYVHRKWHYQIVEEDAEKLVLERLDDTGKPTKVEVIVRGAVIWVGFGKARIPLTRTLKR